MTNLISGSGQNKGASDNELLQVSKVVFPRVGYSKAALSGPAQGTIQKPGKHVANEANTSGSTRYKYGERRLVQVDDHGECKNLRSSDMLDRTGTRR